jgi:hypothetical protein
MFAAVLAVCDAQGLISREMFAIDGVKLPSHAAKQRSGTRADFEQQATKLETAARTLVERHRAADHAARARCGTTARLARREPRAILSSPVRCSVRYTAARVRQIVGSRR